MIRDRINAITGLVIVFLAFLPVLSKRFNDTEKLTFDHNETCATSDSNIDQKAATAFYKAVDIHQPGLTRQTHASALTELGNGNLLAVWYGGTREGSTDSAIYTAVYNSESGNWGSSKVIADRHTTGKATSRFVKKVGNPVIKRDKLGKLQLFYVSVSVGGWSGSAINTMSSADNGESWSPAQRLISSPFFNLSTLVKGEPLLMSDNNLAIPVYHELAGKFGELLFYNPATGISNKTRISYGRASLQPSIAVFDGNNAVAMLRYAGKGGKRVQFSHTSDAGLNWSSMAASNLPNPNAAVSVRCIDSKTLLMAFNNTEKGRYDLSLATSTDGGINWKPIHKIEYAPGSEKEQRFSYPYMIEDSNGIFHISYTWNKQQIKHVSFNRTWLKGKLQ